MEMNVKYFALFTRGSPACHVVCIESSERLKHCANSRTEGPFSKSVCEYEL